MLAAGAMQTPRGLDSILPPNNGGYIYVKVCLFMYMCVSHPALSPGALPVPCSHGSHCCWRGPGEAPGLPPLHPRMETSSERDLHFPLPNERSPAQRFHPHAFEAERKW